ncbi:sensor histidine kinase [Sulfoacidibacillus thermotolerans]|uniref:histidine kinase n=1 Tax=Sulfoacidibacillus thermotolerans TaxID=1765684 RepID=A0A2U3DBA9_SULT2|nr:histidine kinase [Sulfoacidibacillus thermotolerans]PWI58568.1 hypothetical protein BM613_03380 [Sulfoacidibacillus thermotolerans]
MKHLFHKENRTFGYLYLFQLLIPLFFLFTMPLKQLLLGLSLLLIFAFAYIQTYRLHGKSRYIWIAVESLLVMIMAALLSGWFFWLDFYPAAAIGALLTRRQLAFVLPLFILCNLADFLFLLQQHGDFSIDNFPIIAGFIISLGATSYITNYQMRIQIAHRELQRAQQENERLAKIAERERISADLHDVIGHELALITLKSQLAKQLLTRDLILAKGEISDIENAARQALTQVREYITGIRQADFEEEWQEAMKFLQTAGIRNLEEKVQTHCELPLTMRQTLAFCLRETTTNIVRHSQATEAVIRLFATDKFLCLYVADNGIGLEHESTTPQKQKLGYGLSSLNARLDSIGGRVFSWSNGVALQPWDEFTDYLPQGTQGLAWLFAVPKKQ